MLAFYLLKRAANLDVIQRVIEATASVLGAAARLTHEALFIGVDFLKFAPVPALEVAGVVLLNIWEAVELIEACLIRCLLIK